MSEALPRTFEAWRNCIEHDCGVALTLSFIDQRLAALCASEREEAQRFVRLYGLAYWRQVIAWFEQAKQSVSR